MSKFVVVVFNKEIRVGKDFLSRVNKAGNPPDRRFLRTSLEPNFDDRMLAIKDPSFPRDIFVPFENIIQLEKDRTSKVESLAKARAAKGKKNADD